ncbi:GPI transamidase [Penicillium alfredii]|uniref:GPI transamidase n=1 Tax=Penicillium alfredii TaxID=1506179 RepID=A0A9W9FSU8_9EURO|nr:GPI transamidase [Penicillium alfredii]KAJ5105743.1 GPI transamidase [Penicillium alfredii]
MTVLSLLTLPLLALALTLWSSPVLASDYHEQLFLQPLPQSSLLASFNFRGNTSQQSFEHQHFRYFPRALGQIIQHAHTRELHLRFTTGRWDAQSWGPRPWNGGKEGGTGVELWAWIDAPGDEEAFSKWVSLTQSLSGLFCASLNFVDSTRTTRPVVSFEPAGDHTAASQLHFLHGTLPGEVVCTENLTPFLKLLPCKGKAGISTLFDGHKLFDASWQSMSVDVRPVCPRKETNMIPRPVRNEDLVCDTSKPYNSEETCYPLEKTTETAWSLNEIFGRTINGVCPLAGSDGASEPTVCLRTPHERGVLAAEGAIETKKGDGFTRCYNLAPSQPFDLLIPEQPVHTQVPLDEPILHAERTIVGHGQERGGMRIIFGNPSNASAVDFIYFETLPWFLRPYIHTLRATITGRDGMRREVAASEIIKETFYRPAIDRERGTQLELALSVPAASTVTLTYDFEKAILRYTEYPPDANRGFNVAPAVIRILDPAQRAPLYLRSTSLLLPLPTPDFSMPYNVIILTSTVIALAFGTIFNIMVRRVVSLDEAAALGAQTLKGRLLGKVVALRDRFKGKGTKVE